MGTCSFCGTPFTSGELRAHEAICPYRNNPGVPVRLREQLEAVLGELTKNSQVVFMHAARAFASHYSMERTGEGDSYRLGLFVKWANQELEEQIEKLKRFTKQVRTAEKTILVPFPLNRLGKELKDLREMQTYAKEVVDELNLLTGH